jgi:peptide/nickel transport system permease protein
MNVPRGLAGTVGRRLLQSALLLLGVIVLTFALIQAAPGSFVDVMTSDQQISDPAQIAHLRVLYGMDQPAWVQLLRYIWAVLHLDLGFSYRQNMPVLDAILGRLPATLLLMLTAMSVALVIGVAAGIVAALKVNTVWDSLVSVLAVLCFATPSFWLGIMLIILFSVKLHWLPVGDIATIGGPQTAAQAVLDVVRHLVLPATSLGLFYAAVYARMMRASMLEVMHLDFVRTARAKGLSRARVIAGHVVRNALLPVVTLLGLQLGSVLGGSVVVESVFSWPGLGSLLFDSVSSRNYPVVLGVMVFSALVVILVNIAVDVAYVRLDPRTRRQ